MKAIDYKGKWFILCDDDRVDELDYEMQHIDTEHVCGDGLESHVRNCLYYGIPDYIGSNQELHTKIAKIKAAIANEIMLDYKGPNDE